MSSIVKIGIALLLFWAVLSSSDWNSVIVHFTNLDLTIIALLVAITLAQAAVLAVRWRAIAKPSFPEFTFRSSFAGTLISFFFSQGLPSSIGGDAFRIWWVRRNGVALSEATAYVMFDRVVGLLSLLILCAFSLALLGARANQETYAVMSSVLATTILAGLVCAAILMYPKRLGVSDRATAFAARCPAWLGTLITLLVSIRKISVGYTRNVLQFLALLSMGVGVHLMTVYIGYIVATELLDTISFADCLAVVAPALLISYLPISIAGWGVREGAIVAAFAMIGVSTSISLVVSVMIGGAVLLTSLIGGGIWVFGGLRETFERSSDEKRNAVNS